MVGHGGPKTSRAGILAALVGPSRAPRFALWLLLGWLTTPALADDQSLRVRISWGGGQPRRWEASIALSEGTLSELVPLGIEADEPGSMWLSDGKLRVVQRSPRSYDALDVTLLDALHGQLTLIFTALDPPEEPIEISVAVAQLASQEHLQPLDDRQNRLSIRRGAADRLRVKLERDHLVFAPGETCRFDVQPQLLGVPGGSRVQLRLQLASARESNRLWSEEQDFVVDALASAASLPFELPLPVEEGAYDLVISAWQQGFPLRLARKHPLAERRVQVVVVSEMAGGLLPQTPASYQQLGEIDPLQSNWLNRLPNLPLIAGGPKGPLGNGRSKRVQHPLGPMLALTSGPTADDLAWEAYPLPVGNLGEPHILEVDYPANDPQSLGISIVEPNAAGAVVPIGLDSGVSVSRASEQGRLAKHRLVFWPRTRSPLALLTNLRTDQPATFAKLRVLGGTPHLERAAIRTIDPDARLLAAYMSRPLFPEGFSASEALDTSSGRSLDDWVTFYQGGTRLVEYLQHVGYNGLMLSVLADGSAIYPSALVEPTPRYDTGMIFEQGQDPIRKDALELLFRLFDREDLQLIPSVQFAAPLPILEKLKREPETNPAGLELVGPDGEGWLDHYPPVRGLAPYYNPLDPPVQDAMLAVIKEVAQRYAHHPAFGGLAVELSGRGYAQLPGAEWGLDDKTVSRFERATGVRLPAADRAQRVEVLLSRHRAAWIKWRAAEMTALYGRMQRELAAIRPGTKLYLSCAELLDSPAAQQALRPALPRQISAHDLLLDLGLDVAALHQSADTVLLQPQWPASREMVNAEPQRLEFELAVESEKLFSDSPARGSLFFHGPHEIRLASFDQKSPFRETFMLLLAQTVPSADENRRRFVHSLATLDAQAMFDGGWLLPRGQEESISDLISVYRALPAERFNTVGDSTQPVTVRSLTRNGQTWVYLVNDSPWPTSVEMRVTAPANCRIESFGRGPLPDLSPANDASAWRVELRPYDLVAARFGSADVRISDARVTLGGDAAESLERTVRELNTRAATLASPPAWNVLDNAGFEAPPIRSQPLPGWSVAAADGARWELQSATPRNGARALWLTSTGGTISVASAPFNAPPSGRLTLRVWMRIADSGRQPVVRLAVEGRLGAQPYARATMVGRGHHPLSSSWTQYEFAISDLPLDGLSQVRVRFDLLDAGEVWIDDVQLFHLLYLDMERVELQKILHLAGYSLERGELADCARLLEGYWPRFLQSHVPAAPQLAALPAAAAQGASPAKPKPGMLERLNRMNPFR